MKLFPSLSDELARWAEHQPVFFTGSAPIHGGHINVSPKGLADSHFAVLTPNRVAYIDRTGSGCETIAHSYENGRLCLMFMSFGNTPRILRLFCRSHVVEWDQPNFNALVREVAKGKRDAFDAARAVIVCDVWQVQTSCGFGVPRVKKAIYSPEDEDKDGSLSSPVEILRDGSSGDKVDELCVFEERPTLDKQAGGQVDGEKVQAYHRKTNVDSIDGLPGLRTARRAVGQTLWLVDLHAWALRTAAEWRSVALGFFLALFAVAVAMGPFLESTTAVAGFF